VEKKLSRKRIFWNKERPTVHFNVKVYDNIIISWK